MVAGAAFAQESTGTKAGAGISYPVSELGNCGSEAECRSYCDKKENGEKCFSFAEKNGLMSAEEVQRAKKFASVGNGPGGCTTKDSCEAYCNDIKNIDVCVSFAEKNGLMSEKELGEARKVREAIKRGVKPPACGNKKECDTYCEQSDHMEECIAFGEAAGFISGQELQNAKKMLTAIKRGVKPLPCKGRESCDAFCGEPENMEACITFASEAGFMEEKELEESKKVLSAIKQGIKPPKCRGEKECNVYCSEESHFEECTKFAEAAGFMSKEDAERARRTGGAGPGGCRSKDECDAFCGNPDNQETCFNFAKESGFLKEGDERMFEEGRQNIKESLNQAPPEVQTCLSEALGSDAFQKLKSGTTLPSKDIGEKMRECFEKGGSAGMPPLQGSTQGEFRGGPGGCKTPEECRAYCESHSDECRNFGGQPGPEGANIRGGIAPFQNTQPPFDDRRAVCKTPEECKEFCAKAPNPEECAKGISAGWSGQPGNNMPTQSPGVYPADQMPVSERQLFDPTLQQGRLAPYGGEYQKPYPEGGFIPPTGAGQEPNNYPSSGTTGGQYPYPSGVEGQYPYPTNDGSGQYQYPPNSPVPLQGTEGGTYMPPAEDGSASQPTSKILTPELFVGLVADALRLFMGVR